MKLRWARANPSSKHRLGFATLTDIEELKSAGAKGKSMLRPATHEDIAEHVEAWRSSRQYSEATSILEKWGFNDEFMPVEGAWSHEAEQRAGQAYNAIRTRLDQLGLMEGSGYERPLDQMLAEYYTDQGS
jgi:hypothetical protein